MGKDEALLGASLAGCAVLIVAVMLFPSVRTRIIDTEPEPEPEASEAEVTITAPSRKEVLKSLRGRALTDGGASVVDPQVRVLATFGWGTGKGQLARLRPRDGEPEAPMSVAVDAAGAPWVLDQVNGRLVKAGSPDVVPIAVKKAKDFAIAKNGNAVVVNDAVAAVVGPDGKTIASYSLGARPHGVYVDGEDVYVGLEGGALARIGDTSGAADSARHEVPGRPTRDGRSFVSATLADGARGRIVVMGFDRTSRDRRFIKELALGMPVMNVLLLDSDAAGVIYLAALGERSPFGGSGDAVATVDLLCLDPHDGRALARAELPANTSADDTFRELAALESGGVVYLYRTEANAELRRVDCR